MGLTPLYSDRKTYGVGLLRPIFRPGTFNERDNHEATKPRKGERQEGLNRQAARSPKRTPIQIGFAVVPSRTPSFAHLCRSSGIHARLPRAGDAALFGR